MSAMMEKGTIAYQEMGGDGWQTLGIVSYGRHAPRARQMAIIMTLYQASDGLRQVVESYYERGQTFDRAIANSAERPEAGLYTPPLRREVDGDILFAS